MIIILEISAKSKLTIDNYHYQLWKWIKKVKFNALVLRTEDYARAAAPEYRADLNIVTPMLGPEDKKNV